MGEIKLEARPFLGGADVAIGDGRLRELVGLSIVSVAVPMGGDAEVASALEGLGLGWPEPTRAVLAGDDMAVRSGADQALVIGAGPEAEARFCAAVDGRGYWSCQSDNWVGLELSGASARGALWRLCPVDIDDAVFPVGASARTVMEHLGVMLVRTGDATWVMLSASSSAQSFWHAVETSLRWTTP